MWERCEQVWSRGCLRSLTWAVSPSSSCTATQAGRGVGTSVTESAVARIAFTCVPSPHRTLMGDCNSRTWNIRVPFWSTPDAAGPHTFHTFHTTPAGDLHEHVWQHQVRRGDEPSRQLRVVPALTADADTHADRVRQGHDGKSRGGGGQFWCWMCREAPPHCCADADGVRLGNAWCIEGRVIVIPL